MVEPIAPDGCAHLAGDGEYAVEVVGVTAFQDTLEWLARGRGETPTDYACMAVLVPEPEDSDDPEGVAVTILGEVVGFLTPEAAAQMRAAMEAWDFDQATCEAVVGGGWYRTTEDKGDFQVWLDINPDFAPALIEDTEEAAEASSEAAAALVDEPVDDQLEPAVAIPVVAPRKIGITLRELSMAAAAVIVVLAGAGLAWIAKPTGLPAVLSKDAALPVAPMVSERQRLAARVAWVEPAVAVTGSDMVSAVVDPRPVLRPTTMPVQSPAAVPPTEIKTQAATPLPVARPPQAKIVASPETKAVMPETATDSPDSRTLSPTTRKAAAAAPQRPPRQSALSIASVPPVRPRNESAVSQSSSTHEVVGLTAVGHAPGLAVQADALAAPPPASPAAPRPAASTRTEAMAPVAAPKPKRAIVPREPRTDETKAPRSRPTRSRSRSESRRSRPPHHHRWLHRTTAEEPPVLRPLPPPPAPAMRGPRPLRPGETMATRLFEDGVKEWTEKAIPAAMAPRYSPY